MTENQTAEFMTLREVAEWIHIAPDTLRYWRTIDSGPASFKIGKRVLYRRNEVEEWFTAQESATRRGGHA